MEVRLDIYNWLRDAGLIDSESESFQNGKCVIKEESAVLLENGLNFTPLIKRLNKIKNKLDREATPMPEINSLKDVKSAAAKLYNWKILTSALEMLGIKIDADSRSLIIAGDRDMVAEILEQIHEAEVSSLQSFEESEVISNSSRKITSSIETTPKKTPMKQVKKANDRSASFRTKKKPDGSLYIESIKAEKPLETSESCLEFLLVSFCKNFALRPKQAAGLLTQGGKYLAYVISKGLKGKFGPIINWYQEIYNNIPVLIKLVINEEANGSVPLMLASLKSGFTSKNIETVLWCCRIFSKLGSELFEQDLLPPAWDWFVSEGGGLESCLLACKRFGPQVKSQIVSVFVQFARNNFYELITIQMRSFLSENVNYITTMNEFLPNFTEIRAAKQELVSAGIVDYWIEMGVRASDPENNSAVDSRLSGINFICDLWMEYPYIIENHEIFANDIISSLKKGWRDKYVILKVACIGKAFQLLEAFTNDRNAFAPIIYKTLTFYLVENYRDLQIREFILYNFINLFENIASVPVGILLEPLVKQFQVSNDLEYGTADFDFFTKIAKHPRLTIKHGVQTMDALGKMYMNSFHYMKSAAIPFMAIATRFIEGSSVKEYLYRFVKYAIKLAYNLEVKNKSDSDVYNEKKMQRDSMLDLAQKIIKLRNETVNEKILNEICEVNAQIKGKLGNNSKALIVLLRIYGDPREIIESYAENHENEENNENSFIMDEDDTSRKKETVVKKKNSDTQSSTTSLNSLNILPRGRAGREIEKIRQNLLEKELEAKLKLEKSKASLENRKRVLRKQVERRRIELGVSSKIDSEAGPVEAKSENKPILQEISNEDRETIGFILKRYQRVLKLLFKKYSSTGYKASVINKATFAEESTFLTDSEFYKLLKEQGVTTSMITLEEFFNIMKTYCHKQKKTQIKVNFLEFQELIIQSALFIYAKPPKDFSHYSPAVSVKVLFDHFRKASAEKGISTKFYDEPDPGVGDRDIVKRLNILLEKDPNTPIPEGYKKVVEKDIELVYSFPKGLEVSEGKKVCVEILDELLEKLYGIHVLEPIIVIKTVTRARGVLSKPQVTVESDLGSAFSNKFNISQMGITYHKAVYQPTLPTELNLTPGIKFEIARLTGRYSNEDLYECSKLLDDLIHTVDSGSTTLISRNNKQKIVNKAQILKEQNLSLKKNEEEKKEKIRRLRRQLIEEKLQKAKANKDNKLKEEQEKKKADELKKKEIIKKNEEKRKEENEKREKELSEWKIKKKEEMEKIKQEEAKKKIIADENRKKQIEEFKLKEKQKLQKSLEEKSLNKTVEEKPPKPEEKKKKLEKVFLKDKLKKEENLKNEEKFKSLMQSAEIQQIFGNFQRSVDLVFNHYCKSAVQKDGTANTTLVFVGFNKFCLQFNVTPGLTSMDECLKIFRAITKSKPTVSGVPISLEIDDFKESLVRLSQISKQSLEKDLSTTFNTEAEALKGLFEYLNINSVINQTRDLLQNLEIKSNNAHPRDKKRMGNQLNKSLSRDITPSTNKLRSKSSAKALETSKVKIPENS